MVVPRGLSHPSLRTGHAAFTAPGSPLSTLDLASGFFHVAGTTERNQVVKRGGRFTMDVVYIEILCVATSLAGEPVSHLAS